MMMANKFISTPAAQCHGKQPFKTRGNADKVAARSKHCGVYHCPHCGQFHIGHKQVPVRRTEGNHYSERF